MLSKYRRPGSPIWHCRGTHLGVSVRKSTRTGEAGKAEAIIGQWQREIEDREIYGKKPEITFAEAALIYMEDGGERRFMDKILDHFGERTLCDEIDRAAVIKARKELYPTAKEATVRRQLETPIRAVLRVAREEDRANPPFLRARRRKVKPGETIDEWRTRWLTPEEFEHFLATLDAEISEARRVVALASAAVSDEDGDYVKFQAHKKTRSAARQIRDLSKLRSMVGYLIGTGCRPIEMFELQAPLFFPNTREAYIAKSKTANDRKVRWCLRAADLIASAPLSEEGAVWRTWTGEPYVGRANRGGQIATLFNRIRDKAGFDHDVTPYTLRHTWATWFYASTKDLLSLMKRGGWKRSEMASRYTKMTPDDLAARLESHEWMFTSQTDRKPSLKALEKDP